jgi:uncharacterized protein (DUF1330 family)
LKGYWIIFGTDIIDSAAQHAYSRLWAPISEKYNAKIKVLETGALVESHISTRVLTVEFPNYEQAKACYSDPAYDEAKQFAVRACHREMIIIEGNLA